MIEKYLDHEKFAWSVATSERAGHASLLAREARDKGTDIVVAVGGDGTVNEVARAIVHSRTALGIIPCGSGNGLARHLLMPLSVRKSIEVINACEIHSLDFGTINDHPFFCTCGMGFDALISQRFAESNRRGLIGYAENILKSGLTYRPLTYEIIDGGATRMRAFLISIANASQYGSGAYIAPQASMSDGLLDVIIMQPFDLIEVPQISIEMFNKTLDRNPRIKTFRTKELHIRRSEEGVIHCDGDPIIEGKELHVKIHERGVNIIINPFADKSERKPGALQTATSQLMNEINALRENLNSAVRGRSQERVDE